MGYPGIGPWYENSCYSSDIPSFIGEMLKDSESVLVIQGHNMKGVEIWRLPN